MSIHEQHPERRLGTGCSWPQPSDYLLDRLSQWGISRIYGYPGDGINGILGALDRARERMHLVQVRHEEMAAFMACAHAKSAASGLLKRRH